MTDYSMSILCNDCDHHVFDPDLGYWVCGVRSCIYDVDPIRDFTPEDWEDFETMDFLCL